MAENAKPTSPNKKPEGGIVHAKPVEQPALPQLRTLEDDLARAKGNAPRAHNLGQATPAPVPTPGHAGAKQDTPLEKALGATIKEASQEVDQRTKLKKKQQKQKKYTPYSTRIAKRPIKYDTPKSLTDLKKRPGYLSPIQQKPLKKKRGGFFSFFKREKKEEVPTILDTILEEAPTQNQSTVQTYKDDLNQVVKERNESMLSIALAEEKNKARQARTQKTPKTHSGAKSLIFGLVSLILLATGGWFIFIGYENYVANQTPARTTETGELFRSEHTLVVDTKMLTPDYIRDLINTESKDADTVTHIQVTETEVLENGESATYTLLGHALTEQLLPTIPPALLRTVTADGAMYGIHHNDTLSPNDPFIILKVDSFELALSEMLAWEPRLYEETRTVFRTIEPFIKIKTVPKEEVPDAPEDAPDMLQIEEVIPVETTFFKDALLKNRDVRVIRDPVIGNVLFLYGFADPETLIITTDSSAFIELSERLNRAKVK